MKLSGRWSTISNLVQLRKELAQVERRGYALDT
jgi:DNA-binding IclR family transcriptional regulator